MANPDCELRNPSRCAVQRPQVFQNFSRHCAWILLADCAVTRKCCNRAPYWVTSWCICKMLKNLLQDDVTEHELVFLQHATPANHAKHTCCNNLVLPRPMKQRCGVALSTLPPLCPTQTTGCDAYILQIRFPQKQGGPGPP